MTPPDLARLHARCFSRPRPWTEAEFASLLDSTGVFLVAEPHGFALGRAVAGEAELLTLAVDPACRRRGVARGLLARFETEACARGAASAFLEVASDNAPAQALYASAGFTETGRRRNYYAGGATPPADAVLLAKSLAAPAAPGRRSP